MNWSKIVRNFEFWKSVFKYSRETDTVKHFGNYVFQPSIADFVVVDEKDTKGLTVDIPTVDYQEVQKTLDV